MSKTTNHTTEKIIIIRILAIVLLLSSLLVLAEAICVNAGWLNYEYAHQRSFAQEINGKEQLGKNLMDYCWGHSNRLIQPEFFNHRELRHLEDVRAIGIRLHFYNIFTLLIIFIIACYCIYCLIKDKKKLRALAHSFYRISVIILPLTWIVAAIVALNFDKLYDKLHELLFDNYLWILNPKTDRLLCLVNPEIVSETALCVLVIWSALLLLLALLSRRTARKTC